MSLRARALDHFVEHLALLRLELDIVARRVEIVFLPAFTTTVMRPVQPFDLDTPDGSRSVPVVPGIASDPGGFRRGRWY